MGDAVSEHGLTLINFLSFLVKNFNPLSFFSGSFTQLLSSVPSKTHLIIEVQYEYNDVSRFQPDYFY